MFDETYPDPVRVVSIGVPIEDLLADPTGQHGLKNSVEFCGGTHLTNSKHIGSLVLLTEEAIAKGVRRVIAVTGQEAVKANNRAQVLQKEVDELSVHVGEELKKQHADLPTLSKKIYNLNDTISHSQISYWRKDAMRHTLDGLKKNLLDLDKVQTKALLAKAQEELKALIADDKSKDVEYLVREFKIGGDVKSLNDLMKSIKASLPQAPVMLFSVDELNGKILCISSVPDAKVTQLKANEWINEISTLMGGKGGGRENSAQATGSNASSLSQCIDLASKFAQIKLQN